MKLVVTDTQFDEYTSQIAKRFPSITLHLSGSSAEQADLPHDADAALLWFTDPSLIDPLLATNPKLKWLHASSTGVENYVTPALRAHPALLTNARGLFADPLGEWVIGGMLYFAKNFKRLLDDHSACRWERHEVEELKGKTLVIYGYGSIGRAIAKRAHAFDMHIVACRRSVPQSADEYASSFVAPAEICSALAQADYLAVATPLTQETRGAIGAEELAALPQHAVVINVGRGDVIDETALVDALRDKRLLGAALDVFSCEPLPSTSPFFTLGNVLLSPHSADRTASMRQLAIDDFLANLERYLNEQPLAHVVDKALGY
ncbi:MAG: D-2-hydroxyacid dehydrogenase [Bdellovibrionales bacterium]|nr:D-2-hydroxyacid dehydrogenase [Bdellovibrionales bacterium]